MKNIFRITTVIILVFAFLPVSLAERDAQIYCGENVAQNDYAVIEGTVTYCGKTIPGAVVEGFESLGSGSGYAKDIKHVYFKGEVIPETDSATFHLIMDLIMEEYLSMAQDKNGVYCQDSLLTKDIENFKSFDTYFSFFRDSTSVYYYCTKLENSDAATFVKIDGDFYKDTNNIYYQGHIIKADTKSFQVLTGGYAKDKESVFFRYDGVVDGANPSTFMIRIFGVDDKTISKECGDVHFNAYDDKSCFENKTLVATRKGKVLIKRTSHFSDMVFYLYQKRFGTILYRDERKWPFRSRQ